LAGRTGLGESQVSGALESLLPMLLEFVQKEGGGLEALASESPRVLRRPGYVSPATMNGAS
jgi:hypothetical protein